MSHWDPTEVLLSKAKMKILVTLARTGRLNITRLVKATSLNHATVERHLRELLEAGIIIEERTGRLRFLELNTSNPIARCLILLYRGEGGAKTNDGRYFE